MAFKVDRRGCLNKPTPIMGNYWHFTHMDGLWNASAGLAR